MDLSESTFSRLAGQVQDGLRALYNKAALSFSAASPYGHILEVVQELFRMNTLQQKRIVQQFDITNPANNNRVTVRGQAVLGQHNPSRAIAASGTLRLQVKSGIDIAQEVKGGKLTVYNRTRLRNEANGLVYSLDLGADRLIFNVSPGASLYLNAVQGQWVEKGKSGNGLPNQTFNITATDGREIDNHRFNVSVNSKRWSPRVNIVDMLPEEEAYTCRTGISGGLDVGFGNDYYGQIPPLASIILVDYLVTDGAEGNVPNPQINEFKFIDDVFDEFGGTVDMEGVFDISVSTPMQFGADGESVEFTRSIMPFVSTNFVLARPENFIFYLQRLGIFSVVDAYVPERSKTEDLSELKRMSKLGSNLIEAASGTGRLKDRRVKNLLQRHTSEIARTRQLLLSQSNSSVVHLFLVPDVRNYYGEDQSFDYFTVPNDAFLLDAVEKERIFNYLSVNGTTSLITDVQIVDPTVKRYIVNITIRCFKDAEFENVRAEIHRAVSDYFLDMTRRDRIPPSDLIRIVEDVYGVDSADVSFMSEDTEKYHAEYNTLNERFQLANFRVPLASEIQMSDGDPYDPYWSPGIDPLLGDIVIGKQDLPLLRGGWADRNGQYYTETPQPSGLGPLNIVFTQEPSQSKIRALQQTRPAEVVVNNGRQFSKLKSNIGMGHAL